MSARIRSIDTAKGLAILFVVFIHTEPFLASETLKADWYYVGQVIQQVSSVAVPFFFVAAGFLFSKGLRDADIFPRWKKYALRLALLLIVWTLVDGVLWGQWLAQVAKAGSGAPLWWNVSAIPSFAAKRPDLFWFRGTAVPLWFLVSLLLSVSVLAAAMQCGVSAVGTLAAGLVGYIFCLAASSYSGLPFGLGWTLPLEQRGPLIGFCFISLGRFLATRQSCSSHASVYSVLALVAVFLESSALSHAAGVPFEEHPYVFSTVLLAASVFLFSLQHPDWGAGSVFESLGRRSLGIYLVHTPVLGALGLFRTSFDHPAWEVIFPIGVLLLTLFLVSALHRIPYARAVVS